MAEALVAVGGGLGDVIMTTPVISAVHSLGYIVDVVLKEDIGWTKEILDPWDIIRNVHIGDVDYLYDVVVYSWWFSPNDAVLRGKEHKETYQVDRDHIGLTNTHEIVANMTSVQKLGFMGAIPQTHISTNGQAFPNLPEHYVVICPGYSNKKGRWFWVRKQWPHWERFMAKNKDLTYVILGSKTDAKKLPPIYGRKGKVINLLGKTTISEAVSIIHHADFVVAVDNGLSHVAAALKKPLFVLFGATTLVKSRPLGDSVTVICLGLPCQPCQMTDRWRACEDWQCMNEITPDLVWSTIKETQDVY